MLSFYKKVFFIIIGLLILSVAVGLFCFERTFLHSKLLPNNASSHPWQIEAVSDIAVGGASTIAVNNSRYSLNFDFTLSDKTNYPYTSLALVFAQTENLNEFVNFSAYQNLTFSVKCKPANILTFVVFTIDKRVTDPNNISTYRIPTTFFSCNESWTHVNIDLTRLETPQWWFSISELALSEQRYSLDQVPRVTFGNSFQSPYDIKSNVQVDELVLHGKNWKYLYVFCALMIVLWGLLIFWVVKQHTKTVVQDLKEKLQKDRPLIAYQQLSLKPQRNSDKDSIFRYMATAYSNPDLNLNTAIANLAVNRTKLNDILKEELGYTFVSYLNKIRLTEAARILAQKEDISITEVAYSVGYKNVSYFNKLFKNEYGCTPKLFKSSYPPSSGN